MQTPESERQVKYIIKKYSNGDVKFKELRNPITIKSSSRAIASPGDSKNKLENRIRTNRRTQQAIYDLLYGREFDWFVTITFGPEITKKYSIEEYIAKTKRLLDNLREKRFNQIEYFYVWEWNNNKENVHVHLLINGIPDEQFVPAVDNREEITWGDGSIHKNSKFGKQFKDKSGNLLYHAKFIRFGFTLASRVSDMERMATYLSKSVSRKNIEDSFPYRKGVRRYSHSESLKRPIKTSVNEKELEELLSKKDSWLRDSTDGLNIEKADTIQSKSKKKNLIVVFRNNKDVEVPDTENNDAITG